MVQLDAEACDESSLTCVSVPTFEVEDPARDEAFAVETVDNPSALGAPLCEQERECAVCFTHQHMVAFPNTVRSQC